MYTTRQSPTRMRHWSLYPLSFLHPAGRGFSVILLFSIKKKYFPPNRTALQGSGQGGRFPSTEREAAEASGLCSADTPVRVFAAIPPSARTRVSALHSLSPHS